MCALANCPAATLQVHTRRRRRRSRRCRRRGRRIYILYDIHTQTRVSGKYIVEKKNRKN
jgi:hypothetical protein